jgi:hypothetical protein
MEAFITGLGLSSSAGLNAYLPLVLLSLAQQSGAVELEGSLAEAMTSPPALAVWIVLLLIEMTVDKIPGIDSLNDVVSTVIRPTAGTALMYASMSGVDNQLDPDMLLAISVLAGGASAGGVHATKAVTRPAVTVSTGGLGNSVVSIIEDIISLIVALFALVLPIIIIFFMLSFVFLIPWWLWEQQRLDRLRHRGLVR